MRRFLFALALTCAFSGTVLAGNIPTSGIAPPPDPNPLITVIVTIINLVV